MPLVPVRPLLGSSPLARGTHNAVEPFSRCSGLIPARAGNTQSHLLPMMARRAHPRSRGEHLGLLLLFSNDLGSSPLARGTRVRMATHEPCTGLIPARAGNTRRLRRLRGWMGAHPRSRGEHELTVSEVRTPPGSSPLARGTPEEMARTNPNGGLIPARAGNTLKLPPRLPPSWAHPRSRGEHSQS